MIISLDVHEKKALIVGGGKSALIKAKKLYDNGCIITVVAKDVFYGLNEICDNIFKREYIDGDESGYFIVVCATDDALLNERIADRCDKKGILYLNVSGKSSFDMVMSRKIEDIELCVSTGGKNAGFSKYLCEKLVDNLDDEIINKFNMHTLLRKKVIEQDLDRSILKDALNMSSDEIYTKYLKEEKQ